MNDMQAARDAIHQIDMTIANLERETNERITRGTGLDGDYSIVSREEWGRFHDQVRPLRAQQEAIIQAMVTVHSMQEPSPMIIPAR
jgi:hypothetical protein